jgi:glutathione synthase/RimK-type ligase-like ATP-grasp enzyme
MQDLIDAAAQPFAPLIGVAPLMRLAFFKHDLAPLGKVLLERAQNNPEDANAWLDCSTVLQLTGDHDVALNVQFEAIRINPLYSLPAPQGEPGLRLLTIMGPGDLMANTPIEFLLEESDVALDMLYLTLDAPWPETVPEHDVLLVALAESEANQPLLQDLSQLVAHWPRPVLNAPDHIAKLSRDGVCAALNHAEGVDIPRTVRVMRADMLRLAGGELELGGCLPGDNFPLIVRPIGSHAGTNLEKVEDLQQLSDYLARIPAEQYYLSRFVDYRSSDGQFRKYRVVLIEGRAFLAHMAISSHWMVHYLNAGMDDNAEKREEEGECMADFDNGFAARHAHALAEIDVRIGLPYLGMDVAETPDGKLLVFEVDNAMIVHAMDPEDKYPYKKPAMKKLFAAFRAMLEHLRQKGPGH